MTSEINTIYIISKERPICRTAKLLNRIGYTGDFYICIQEDDKHKQQYIENFGEDKIITYDYYEQIPQTDFLDNYGNEKTGVVVVRNIIPKIAKSMGCKRYWILDDDITSFRYFKYKEGKFKTINDGAKLEKIFYMISEFGHKTNILKCGFKRDGGMWAPNPFKFEHYVVQIMNLDVNAPPFRGRLAEDDVHDLSLLHQGKLIFNFPSITYTCSEFDTNKDGGGLNDMYQTFGMYRRFAYILLVCPILIFRIRKFRKLNKKVPYENLIPKVINEKYKKEVNDG